MTGSPFAGMQYCVVADQSGWLRPTHEQQRLPWRAQSAALSLTQFLTHDIVILSEQVSEHGV